MIFLGVALLPWIFWLAIIISFILGIVDSAKGWKRIKDFIIAFFIINLVATVVFIITEHPFTKQATCLDSFGNPAYFCDRKDVLWHKSFNFYLVVYILSFLFFCIGGGLRDLFFKVKQAF